MHLASFLLAILCGCLAAAFALMASGNIWIAAVAYSLFGAVALVFSLTIFAYFRPALAALSSLAARDSP